MNIEVSIPLDSDGFVRRECPSCSRQFKWHDGPANEEAESQPISNVFYCPFCGTRAAADEWFTTEQAKYIQAVAMPAAVRSLDDQLGSLFGSMSSKNFQIKKTGHLDVPEQPDPLTEPDDMMIVASPCHSWEPVKVPEDTGSPLHCLICGEPFAL